MSATAPQEDRANGAGDVIEGVAQEVGAEVVRLPTGPALAVTPSVEARELVARLDVIKDAMENAMQRDVDYGVIPGTNKPALYKPGSEKLSVLFQLDVQIVNEKRWGPDDHLTVLSHATVFHAPTGTRLGYGEGLCTTREKKYAKRKQERVCPNCGVAAVIKGKEEYGGGWLCWSRRDGCNSKWPDGADVIEAQDVGEVENPDLPDLWNTVVKMAQKRARVDAVLAVTGASALFTQDVEDDAPPPPPNTSQAADKVQRAAQGGSQKTAAKVDGDQLAALTQKVGDALAGEKLTGQQLSMAFTSVGGVAKQINSAALATLTGPQASRLDTELDKLIGGAA